MAASLGEVLAWQLDLVLYDGLGEVQEPHHYSYLPSRWHAVAVELSHLLNELLTVVAGAAYEMPAPFQRVEGEEPRLASPLCYWRHYGCSAH